MKHYVACVVVGAGAGLVLAALIGFVISEQFDSQLISI